MNSAEEAVAKNIIKAYQNGTLTVSAMAGKVLNFFQLVDTELNSANENNNSVSVAESSCGMFHHPLTIPTGQYTLPNATPVSRPGTPVSSPLPPIAIRGRQQGMFQNNARSPSPRRTGSMGFIPIIKEANQESLGQSGYEDRGNLNITRQLSPCRHNNSSELSFDSANSEISPGSLNKCDATMTHEEKFTAVKPAVEQVYGQTVPTISKTPTPPRRSYPIYENVSKDQVKGARCPTVGCTNPFPHDDRVCYQIHYKQMSSQSLETGDTRSLPPPIRTQTHTPQPPKAQTAQIQHITPPTSNIQAVPSPDVPQSVQGSKNQLPYTPRRHEEQLFITQPSYSARSVRVQPQLSQPLKIPAVRQPSPKKELLVDQLQPPQASKIPSMRSTKSYTQGSQHLEPLSIKCLQLRGDPKTQLPSIGQPQQQPLKSQIPMMRYVQPVNTDLSIAQTHSLQPLTQIRKTQASTLPKTQIPITLEQLPIQILPIKCPPCPTETPKVDSKPTQSIPKFTISSNQKQRLRSNARSVRPTRSSTGVFESPVFQNFQANLDPIEILPSVASSPLTRPSFPMEGQVQESEVQIKSIASQQPSQSGEAPSITAQAKTKLPRLRSTQTSLPPTTTQVKKAKHLTSRIPIPPFLPSSQPSRVFEDGRAWEVQEEPNHGLCVKSSLKW